ncbi:MAG: restriction endonuclease subunit S [Bacteroidetes bacterium]|nr:restriction endonuclease subunit S [Bacteroidota bacterium]
MEWIELPIKKTGDIVTGNTPSRSEEKYYGGNIPWIKPEDLDTDFYIKTSSEYLTEDGAKKARLLPENSILVSCIGNIGKMAIAGCQLATNQQINSVVPKDEYDPVFLAHSIKYSLSNEKNINIALVSILNGGDFGKVKVRLPKTKNDQKRLGILIQNKLVKIEQMRQAALKQKEAVEALQGALLREVFPFKEGDELPKGWKWEKLDKIFEEVKNQVQPYEDEFKTLPFIGLENVVSHTREYTDEEYNPPSSTCFKFDETNILYGKLRPYLNKVYLPTGKGKSSMELIPLKTKNNYSREFLAAVLQSEAVIGDTVKFSTGGRMPRADLKKLKKLEVAIPSDVSKCNELGITVSNKIKEFIDLNKKALTQLEAIEALPAAILREVFEFNKN